MTSTPRAEEVVGLVVESDEILAEGGFHRLRRLRLRNRRADGSLSASYVCDFLLRPAGQDAVVVVLYRRRDDGAVEVLLRDGLRPTLPLGRRPDQAPLPEPAAGLFSRELVAGILERDDVGLEGLLGRAVIESAEEAGVAIDPAALTLLGAGSSPSPGAVLEKHYFVAAELPRDAVFGPLPGDGSPMEEDARLHWMELRDAIDACTTGALISDGKTELGLRRLRDHLACATAKESAHDR